MTKKLISVEQACMGDTPLTGKPKRKKPKKAVIASCVDKLYPGQTCVRKLWYVTSDRGEAVTLRPILLERVLYFYKKVPAVTFARTLNAQLVSKVAKRTGCKFRAVPITMTLTLNA